MEKVNATDYLGKEVNITIDRKLGSKQPKYEFKYMINFEFILNTISDNG